MLAETSREASDAAPAAAIWWWAMGLLVAATAVSIGHLLRGAGVGLLQVLAVAVTAVAAWSDLSRRLIPNALTLPAFAVGLVTQGAAAASMAVGLWAAGPWTGTGGPVDALIGAGAGAAIGVAGFALGGIGGGDAKLLAALGVLLGWQRLGPALLDTLIIGAVLALAGLLSAGRAIAALQRLVAAPGPAFRRGEVPLGVAAFGGVVSSSLWPLHEIIEGLIAP